MFFDDEKRILSEYVYNDPSFNSGLSYFESILINNLNNNKEIELEYAYNREDEEYLKDVYDRVILFIVNKEWRELHLY